MHEELPPSKEDKQEEAHRGGEVQVEAHGSSCLQGRQRRKPRAPPS